MSITYPKKPENPAAANSITEVLIPSVEGHVSEILEQIRKTREAILASGGPEGLALAESDCVFLTFWDFDGTILRGDCTEGNEDYSGLLAEMVLAGLCPRFPANVTGVSQAFDEYDHTHRTHGAAAAYSHVALLLAGAREEDVIALSARHFRDAQQPFLFSASIHLMNELGADGIESHILSASPEVFLSGISTVMGWLPGRVRGIRTAVHDGVLSAELENPVTFAEGKTAVLIEQVEEARTRHPGKHIFVLAAFGNSYETDGHFMRYVASLPRSAGGAAAVMINGTMGDHDPRFLHVCQEEVIGMGLR